MGSISFIGIDINQELGPGEGLVRGRFGEAVVRVVLQIPLTDMADLLARDAKKGFGLITHTTSNIVQAVVTLSGRLLPITSVTAFLVVEGLLLKDSNHHALGDETDQAAGSVDNWVGVVVRFEGLLAGSHVGDGGKTDGVLGHNDRGLEVLGRLWAICSQEWHLLHPEGAIVEGGADRVSDSTSRHNTNHHGQENVD